MVRIIGEGGSGIALLKEVTIDYIYISLCQKISMLILLVMNYYWWEKNTMMIINGVTFFHTEVLLINPMQYQAIFEVYLINETFELVGDDLGSSEFKWMSNISSVYVCKYCFPYDHNQIII